MKQVVQVLSGGAIEVDEVPIPQMGDNMVLVRNVASVISAGTEKTKIDLGKKSLLQKALARPDLVKQVLKKIKTEGLLKTAQTVRTRLNAPSALGYSSAGVVIAVGGLAKGIKPGDRVACAGAGYANHAEVVAIPKNLVAKAPEGVDLETAAFTTLGAIALQGVRLADPKMGETFLVIGLGLLGQITVQLLIANGCNALGVDLDPRLVELAESFGAVGIKPGQDLAEACMGSTGGNGVDGVLVCAGTSSNQPIESCGEVVREKGRVVVVGAVSMNIPREPYFKKEIAVVISRSYGPGRYDPFYEEGGNDYPYGYVRFTEQRNMSAFLDLVDKGRINLKKLITHRFDVTDAAKAYRLIEGEKTEPYLGIVLNYPGGARDAIGEKRIAVNPKPYGAGKRGISLYGAGNYATAMLLPILKDLPNAEFRGLVTSSGRSAQGVAKQFNFSYCASELREILDKDTDIVMIASRHDSHARAVVKALEAGKSVFVEKPLALSVEELMEIEKAYQAANGPQLMVGFNRRFSPSALEVKKRFAGVADPLIVNIRVNAGHIPASHWIQDPKIGGGRIIGEGCHFVDLASFLAGSNPVSVYAVGTSKAGKSAMLNDNVIISLQYANGAAANITYVADGSRAMMKEHVEVFGGGRSAAILDFTETVIYSGDSGREKIKLIHQDKGQGAMLRSWLEGLEKGAPCAPYEELMTSSLATLRAVESLMIGQPVEVSLDILHS